MTASKVINSSNRVLAGNRLQVADLQRLRRPATDMKKLRGSQTIGNTTQESSDQMVKDFLQTNNSQSLDSHLYDRMIKRPHKSKKINNKQLEVLQARSSTSRNKSSKTPLLKMSPTQATTTARDNLSASRSACSLLDPLNRFRKQQDYQKSLGSLFSEKRKFCNFEAIRQSLATPKAAIQEGGKVFHGDVGIGLGLVGSFAGASSSYRQIPRRVIGGAPTN